MRSKVALLHLKTLDLDAMENEAVNWGWYYDNKPKAESVREDIAIIEKDLEILEIIKNKLVFPLALMSLPYELYNQSVIKEQQLTQEEYDKVKEWLKND